jgi:hypothetical protein
MKSDFKTKLINFRFFFLDVVLKVSGLVFLILPILFLYMQFVGIGSFEPKSFRTVQVEKEPKIEIIEMIDKPILNTDLVRDWVSSSMLDIYNYTSTNYNDKGDFVEEYFSSKYAPVFWDQFLKTIEENIDSGVQIVDTVISQKPIVVSEAVINGKRGWKFYVQLYHVYKSEVISQGVTTRTDFIVTVLEQDTRLSKKGVAIDHIKFR